jgi:hypothetical protein
VIYFIFQFFTSVAPHNSQIKTNNDVIDRGCDASRHININTSPLRAGFWQKKNEKVYDLEVFCEVVRFPGVNRDFLWGGYEVISGNKYFLRSCPNFFNDRPLMSSSTMMICFKIQ